MKNIIKIFVSLLIVFSLNSCVESDNAIDDVFQYETGAVLRTIQIVSNSLNSSVPTSAWSVIVEEQDEKDGALLKSVSVYVSIRDLTPGNGTTSVNDVFVKTIDGSAFTVGPVGLPRGTISATFGEATSAMGLSSSQYAPGDLYVFELRLELTDGRIFGASSAAGIITGGFFASPFKYNAVVSCTPEPGTYRLEMQDAYGDGWQSTGIAVSIDGVSTSYRVPNGGNVATANIVVPVGTMSLQWSWAGDTWPDEVSYQVYAPDGTPLGAFIGTDPLSNYGCGCSIISVPGVTTQVAATGLQPILLCAQ